MKIKFDIKITREMHKDWNWIDITCMIVVTGYFRGIFLSNSIKNEISDGYSIISLYMNKQ